MKRRKIKKNILTFNAVFLGEEDGGYSVSAPALPGCFSQGNTFEEAVKNIKEAIELYLEDEGKKDVQWFGYQSGREFMAPVGVYG